jgi:TolB-like protein
MNKRSLWLFRLVFLGLFCFCITVAGCFFTGGAPPSSGSGFIRKELLEYKKAAVLPFQGDSKGEASDTFAESFHEKFPQIELVKKKQVLEVFQEQDLYSDRMDKTTRRKLGQVFGVQAFIVGNVYYPSILRWLLQIQVVDVETGEIMERSLVEIDDMGAEGLKEGCRIAVKNLALK